MNDQPQIVILQTNEFVRLSPVRAMAFFTWNAQSFTGRWLRRVSMAFATFLLPVVYLARPVLALRILHAFLRGVTKDRLDLLGEEYFEHTVKPRLKPESVSKAAALVPSHPETILLSHNLEHIVCPLARHLGIRRVLANRLEFRDGTATGRMLDPVIPPPGMLAATFSARKSPEPQPAESLVREPGLSIKPEELLDAVVAAERVAPRPVHAIVRFASQEVKEPLSVRKALAGKQILLIGATGFIGKVWLANLLTDLPEIGKIVLLIRRQKTNTALRRFEKIVEESPVFEGLHKTHGSGLGKFLGARVEVLDGDITQPGFGLASEIQARLHRELDLIVNSAGLTDFNPDLRDALAINVDGVVNLLGFQRQTSHAALLHLSTCFTVGSRDGRIDEELRLNYTPRDVPAFDVELEREWLHRRVAEVLAESETSQVTAALRRQSLTKRARLPESTLESHVRKHRLRWVRNHMIEAGMRRAQELGWPNTYCYTKSLGESLIAKLGGGLPHAVVRPSITETSTQQPFRGWNEGVNTSAPLSYLLGTYFRQLPSNERKCLDLIPVDLVARGMTLIAAALIERRPHRLYHLATSGCNPCDMRRSIELTCLAHRKFYRAQGSSQLWLKARFDTIAVSKGRYKTFSAPGQRAMVKALRRLTSPIPFAYSSLVRKERDLERLEKLIELYEPFILHNEHAFDARHIELLSAALPPDEQATFGYDAHAIDWWEYWINLHVPALRRWTYPLIEGRPLEPLPRREFRLET